jgi:hypothetical protein
MNFSQKHKAISAFAIFLKKNTSRFGGMRISKIQCFVRQNIRVCGGHTSPNYFLQQIENIEFTRGRLMRWNGAFYKDI